MVYINFNMIINLQDMRRHWISLDMKEKLLNRHNRTIWKWSYFQNYNCELVLVFRLMHGVPSLGQVFVCLFFQDILVPSPMGRETKASVCDLISDYKLRCSCELLLVSTTIWRKKKLKPAILCLRFPKPGNSVEAHE